jgi:hypothetical protein
LKTLRVVLYSIGFVLTLVTYPIVTNASFLDNGDGTITDTDTGLMWLQDANSQMTQMTWSEAMDWADNLLYAGYDDWRLPSTLVPDYSCTDGDPLISQGHCSGSEMGNLFLSGISAFTQGPFDNILDGVFYWSSTEHPNGAFSFAFGHAPPLFVTVGWQDVVPKINSNTYAWGVRVVPEPISAILFIVGGVTLGLRRFMRRKRT